MYAEYPMIRFLEANGYDVSYTTGWTMATATGGSLLTNHKMFMSTGHDEYWSGTQRANVEAARDPASTWRSSAATRCSGRRGCEPSIDGTSTAESHAGLLQGDALQRADRPADPSTWTGHVAGSAVQPAGRRRPAARTR